MSLPAWPMSKSNPFGIDATPAVLTMTLSMRAQARAVFEPNGVHAVASALHSTPLKLPAALEAETSETDSMRSSPVLIWLGLTPGCAAGGGSEVPLLSLMPVSLNATSLVAGVPTMTRVDSYLPRV